MENATQEPKESQNTASAPEDLEAIKAQLEEEQKANAAAEQTIAGKDTRIAELESSLREAQTQSEAKQVELADLKLAKDQAVAKYLNMAKALNPAIPQDIIAGESIDEIDQSIEKGKSIVEAVKATMASEAAATKVPAGAPTRGGISLEGLSPRDKIAYAIQQKGGTQ